MVVPQQLFLKLPGGLSLGGGGGGGGLAPFAWEVAAAWSPHVGLLKQLGVRDTPQPKELVREGGGLGGGGDRGLRDIAEGGR